MKYSLAFVAILEIFILVFGSPDPASNRNLTKLNTPGKLNDWFRNETHLLILWLPPYPANQYTHYKASIEPPDAVDSVLYIEEDGNSPGPAQAAFKGLVPGRIYNISVQTMSKDAISLPSLAQYRTIPLRPLNVTFDRNFITSNSFRVLWEEPKGLSEFEKYQVSLPVLHRQWTVPRTKDLHAYFDINDIMEPGKTLDVVVKAMSGNVVSWPATGNVTLRPLPVRNLHSFNDKINKTIIKWEPDSASTQNEYRLVYRELDTYNGDTGRLTTDRTRITLDGLLPGRNYSLSVKSVSQKMESIETIIYFVAPLTQLIPEDLKSLKTQENSSKKLFTEQEITQLTQDIINGLRSCKTKEDQFNVITSLAIKYLYSNK